MHVDALRLVLRIDPDVELREEVLEAQLARTLQAGNLPLRDNSPYVIIVAVEIDQKETCGQVLAAVQASVELEARRESAQYEVSPVDKVEEEQRGASSGAAGVWLAPRSILAENGDLANCRLWAGHEGPGRDTAAPR